MSAMNETIAPKSTHSPLSKLACIASLAVLIALMIGACFAPNDPTYADVTMRFSEPSAQYPLGTDSMGRCNLSRLLAGGTTTIGIVVLGGSVVAIVGSTVGMVIGSASSKKHLLAESALNAITALPPIAYLIIFIAAWGNGIITMLTAVTVSLFLRLIKLVKTRTEVELERAYVLCAIACGASKARVLFVQVLPNIFRGVIHFICLSSADMILAITAFSFIGLGMGDNVVDWGVMVADAHHYVIANPELIGYPMVCIIVTALAFNILARALESQGEIHAKG